jgi:molybdenum cofactor biosynthesis enzyme
MPDALRCRLLASWVSVRLSLDHENEAVHIRADAETVGPTGVEMEALTGAHTG